MSGFLFTGSISHVEMVRIIVRCKILPGWNCKKDISIGGGFFCGSRTKKSLCYLKKTSEIE